MRFRKFLEFKQEDLDPIKSFKIQDNLNDKVWENDKMIPEIRKDLIKISRDFYETVGIEAEIKDIILTGSLSNYNWSSKYSDFDVHIVITLSDVDKNVELVKKLVDQAKNIWNRDHDIEIEGFDVEVYIQDAKEEHTSNGVYSILKDKWNKKPSKIDIEIDYKEIERKGSSIMSMIDILEEESEDTEYEKFKEKITKVWEKVKDLRKRSLKEEGEFGIGNLVFKLLRRNGYIGKVISLKRDSYDNQFK